MFNGKIHYKSPCSIAMLVITRVYLSLYLLEIIEFSHITPSDPRDPSWIRIRPKDFDPHLAVLLALPGFEKR
jgi:hypothetical protein